MMRNQEVSVSAPAVVETIVAGIEFTQSADWNNFAQIKPDEAVTVLLATEYSIAIGYLSVEGQIEIEFMPWGQEEHEDEEIEFTHWMYLPAAPCWLRTLQSHHHNSPARQLNLWP